VGGYPRGSRQANSPKSKVQRNTADGPPRARTPAKLRARNFEQGGRTCQIDELKWPLVFRRFRVSANIPPHGGGHLHHRTRTSDGRPSRLERCVGDPTTSPGGPEVQRFPEHAIPQATHATGVAMRFPVGVMSKSQGFQNYTSAPGRFSLNLQPTERFGNLGNDLAGLDLRPACSPKQVSHGGTLRLEKHRIYLRPLNDYGARADQPTIVVSPPYRP
jgi:hypothetical protein